MPVPDHPGDTIDIQLLRSTEWIAAVGAVEGGAIYLTLEEMGLYGTANVVEIDPCPEIPEGSGRVVLATITQDNSAIRRLRFEGNELVLAPTDRHRLYSITRAAWTPTEQLEPGEVLITREGNIRIASNERSESSARVYNLQVETEECYYVTPEYILSHNTNPCAQVRVHGFAPDWATKGAHITAGNGVELRLLPGQGGTIVLKPVFSKYSAKEIDAAIKQTENMLQNPEFRKSLVGKLNSGVDYLRNLDHPNAAGKSGEIRFLIKALQKMD